MINQSDNIFSSKWNHYIKAQKHRDTVKQRAAEDPEFAKKERERMKKLYNKTLQRKLKTFARKYPEHCKIDEDNGTGGMNFIIGKTRVTIL